jgi:hypothetical protein
MLIGLLIKGFIEIWYIYVYVYVCVVFIKELLGISVCIFPKVSTRENNKLERIFVLYDVSWLRSVNMKDTLLGDYKVRFRLYLDFYLRKYPGSVRFAL